jgi:hypothetical protein
VDDDLPLRSIQTLEQSCIDVLSACMARLVEVRAICHHEAAAMHRASAVAMTCLAEQTLVLERTLRQVVCRITMGTPPTPSEVRTTSGSQVGDDGLLCLTDSVRRESRHCQKGVARLLRDPRQGDTLLHGMHGVAMAQTLRDTVGDPR